MAIAFLIILDNFLKVHLTLVILMFIISNHMDQITGVQSKRGKVSDINRRIE